MQPTAHASAARPATSKARGLCKYYGTPRGCFAGAGCKFLHGEGERLTPYDKNKTCRFFAAGFCKRGADCWFVHALPAPPAADADAGAGAGPSSAAGADGEDDDYCCICYEKPVTYGLLAGCSHIFCLQCIKGWRDRKGKSEEVVCSGVIKMCPLCRTSSKFVTPSSVFYAQDDPRKAAAIEKYKASMTRVPCKWFERSHPNNRYCPFGNDCFYQHRNADGTHYDFKRGVEHYIKQRARYLDAEGAPIGRLPERLSLLQSLQDALTRIQNSLESIPGLDDVPEDALDEAVTASDLLTEADIRYNDDGTPFVPQSLITTLAEDVMSSIAAFAGEDTLPSPARTGFGASSDVERLESLAIATRAFADGMGHLVGSSRRHASPESPPSADDEVYVVRARPEAVRPMSPVDGSTGPEEEQLVLDYGVADAEPDAPNGHGSDAAQPAHEEVLPASGDGPEPARAAEPHASPDGASAVAEPAQEATGEAAEGAAEVVFDSDPPFRTDGRGRVVWSSATAAAAAAAAAASTRGRKRRTSTSISSGAPAVTVPREGALGDYVGERSL